MRQFRCWLILVRRKSCNGGTVAREQLHELAADRNVRGGEQAQDYREERAEELIRLGLQCFAMGEEELVSAKGGDPRRLLIAEAIWKGKRVAQRSGFRC